MRERIAGTLWDNLFATTGYPEWARMRNDATVLLMPHFDDRDNLICHPEQMRSALAAVYDATDAIIATILTTEKTDA